MRRCCAIDCKKTGIHSFPKNPKICKQWEIALRRKGFKATKTSRLCTDHFTDDDYQKEGFYSGLKVKRKTLKKGVIPTQFAWSKEEEESKKYDQRRKRGENHITSGKPEDSEDTISELKTWTSSVAVADDTNCSSEVEMTDVAMKVNEVIASSSSSHDLAGFKTTSTSDVGSQKNYQFFTIETFMENSKAIKFYTGLESYEKFQLIFSTLCPEVHSLKYKWSQVLLLSVEDQFLLTLIKLRRNKVDFELSFLFDISQTTVANIFVTWINFMHKMWSSREEYLGSYMPEALEKDNSTTSIEDYTEAPVSRPTNPAAQQDLLSSSKKQSTPNLKIGDTPNDILSQCSETHDVGTSDSLNIQDISAKKDTVNTPAFRKVKRQTKALFLFLQGPICKKYLNCMTKINYVCQRLYNYNEGIVPW